MMLLIMLILAGTGVIGGLGYVLASNLYGWTIDDLTLALQTNDPDLPTGALRLLQGFFSAGTFLVPALAFAQLSHADPSRFLELDHKPKSIWVILVLVLFVVISPFIDGVVYLLYNIDFPDSLQWLEEALMTQQEAVTGQMEIILQMDGIGDFLINLFLMAILPAFGEEWLFRGVLQQTIKQRFGNAHLSIWVTAFIFAFFHMSFIYFFALLLMGALLGYLKEWSGSLWLPIIGHFANNAIILFATFFFPELISDVDTITFEGVWFTISLVLSGILIYTLYRNIKTSTPTRN